MWHIAKARYRIRNWSEYNRALVARGDVTRALFNLPLRATQGFLRSVLRLSDFDLGAPDYSTISRRAAKFDVDLARKMPK